MTNINFFLLTINWPVIQCTFYSYLHKVCCGFTSYPFQVNSTVWLVQCTINLVLTKKTFDKCMNYNTYCIILHIPWRITAVSNKAGGVWVDFSGVVKAHKATVVTPSRYGSRSGHCWQWKQQVSSYFDPTMNTFLYGTVTLYNHIIKLLFEASHSVFFFFSGLQALIILAFVCNFCTGLLPSR